MQSIQDRLANGDILICDGAMGTQLQARGLEPGECPELWCLERTNDVRDIHHGYREANSDLVECNSFGGSRWKLEQHGLGDRTAEINRRAAELAREVAGDTQHVLGSVGPTGEFMEPLGLHTEEEFIGVFTEQVQALKDGGAEAVILETMTALEEIRAAAKAALDIGGLTVIASFTFDPEEGGRYATMMGVTPADFATAMAELGVHVVASNCGTGPDDMVNIVAQLRESANGLPLMAMPNAGMPVVENGETVFKQTPEQMAAHVPELIAAGAKIIGGCCGTTPAHIQALTQAAAKHAR